MMKIFRPTKLILAMGLSLSAGSLLTGCNLVETETDSITSTPSTSNHNNILTYVSGKVVDAATQMPIANATVKVKVDGRWLQTTSASGDDHTKGDFRVDGLPSQSFTYDMIVEAPEGSQYAPSYFASDATEIKISSDDETGVTHGILQGISGRGDMGLLKLIPAVATSVTVLDTSGAGIEGLQLHWNAIDNQENSGQIDIQATAAAGGIYSFNIPKGRSITVDMAEAVDGAGNRYQLLSGEEFSGIDVQLTELSSGENETVVLRKMASRDVTVNFFLYDELGEPVITLGSGLQVTSNGDDDALYALQDEAGSNQYSFVAKKQREYSWLLPAVDADGDGLADYATKILAGMVKEPSPRVMDDSEGGVNLSLDENAYLHEELDGEGNVTGYNVTYNVQLKKIEANESIGHEVYSSRLVKDAVAEVKFAFSRPVRLLGDEPVKVTLNALQHGYGDPIRTLSSARVYDSNDIHRSNVSLSDDGEGRDGYQFYANEWLYAYAPGADSSSYIANSWVTKFEQEVIQVGATATLSNNNTLVSVTLNDPSLLLSNAEYDFSLAVEALSDEHIYVVKESVEATEGTAFSLDSVIVDDGDFMQTAIKDAISDSLLIVADNIDLDMNLPGYQINSLDTYAKIMSVENALYSSSSINSAAQAVLFPVPVTGSVKVLSYVETYSDEGVTTTQTHTLMGDSIYSIDFNKSENSAGGYDYTELLGEKIFSLQLPENEGVIDKSEVEDSAFAAQLETGRNIANGIYYRVLLPSLELEHTQGSENGFVSSVTLDLDLQYNATNYNGELANHIKGVKTFIVQ